MYSLGRDCNIIQFFFLIFLYSSCILNKKDLLEKKIEENNSFLEN